MAFRLKLRAQSEGKFAMDFEGRPRTRHVDMSTSRGILRRVLRARVLSNAQVMHPCEITAAESMSIQW